MTASGWRNVAAILAATTLLFAWRSCHTHKRPASDPAPRTDGPIDPRAHRAASGDDEIPPPRSGDGESDLALPPVGVGFVGFASLFAPRRGENAAAYRERVEPIARDAVAPYRERLDEARRAFEADADLDADQLEAVQHQLDSTAEALLDRALDAYLSGQLAPPYAASDVVSLARSLLDIVDDANGAFRGLLDDNQRAALDAGGFDFVEYLLVAAPWEDMIPSF